MTAYDGAAQINGPPAVDAASVAAWLARLRQLRANCQRSIGFTGEMYDVPELQWTQTAYIGPQMHPFDRYFFNSSLGNGTDGKGYTVDRFLADLNTRYGGIDKLLLWGTYPNIGIDDRNQFDMTRALPGGVDGLRKVVAQLHERGVKVLLPYNAWDHSTRGQQHNNVTDPMAMAKLIRDIGADGFNGDTMVHIPRSYYDAAVKIYKPIAMEAEGGVPQADLNYATMGWGESWVADEPGQVTTYSTIH